MSLSLDRWNRVTDSPQENFRNVVIPYLSEALTLARWLTGNHADAEDVVQEASLRAYRSMGQFRGGNARAWMLTIVRNTAYSWIKSQRRGTVVALADVSTDEQNRAEREADSMTTHSNPEIELIAGADAARLETAINTLPKEYCEVLVLRDIQGLSYQEIAEVAGIPLGTVMSRLSRARRQVVAVVRAENL